MASKYHYELPPHRVEYGVTVKVRDLRVDPDGQRFLNEARAQHIADTLVPEAVGSIIVSCRENGDLFTVDGIHRKRAYEILGIETMIAEVHYGLTKQQEAVLFLIKNKESNKPQAFDEYRVGYTARLPLYVDIRRVVAKHSLEVNKYTSANTIGAVAGLVRIVTNNGNDGGAEILDRTLTVAEEAWQRTPATWDGVLLGGIALFLARHGDVVTNNTDLAMKLTKKGIAQYWIGLVHSTASAGGQHNTGTGSRVSTCYQLICNEWNKGKRPQNRVGPRLVNPAA